MYVLGILLNNKMEHVFHALKDKSTIITPSFVNLVLWDRKIPQMDYFVVVTLCINHTLSLPTLVNAHTILQFSIFKVNV